jgi:hypothetical protein
MEVAETATRLAGNAHTVTQPNVVLYNLRQIASQASKGSKAK